MTRLAAAIQRAHLATVEGDSWASRGRSWTRSTSQTLFISLNTVAKHVTSILTKTGTANRVEAAVYAHRHHLVQV